MKKKDLTKAGMLYFIAVLFNKGISFITVPIFSRILSTADYGTVNTFNSWVSTITVFIGLALQNSIRSSFVDYNEKEQDDYLSSILTLTCIVFMFVMAICYVGSVFIPIDVSMALVYLCIVQCFGQAVITDYSFYLMMKYRYRSRTAIMVLPGLISVIVSIVAVLFIVKEKVYMGRIVPTTFIYALFGIIILLLVYRKTRPSLNIEYLKYGLKISLPLILHSVALHILSQSDRIMITWLRNESETGIYSLIYNLGMLAMVITTSLDGIWVPWFTGKLKERKTGEINKLAVDYVNLMTYAMAALLMVSPEILKILAPESYWEGDVIIPPIILANYMLYMYTMYVNVEHFHKKMKYITLNTVISAVLNLVLNFIFIPQYGYVAAAYTTLVSYIAALILHSIVAKRIEPEIYPLNMFIIPLLQIAAAIVIFYVSLDIWFVRWIIVIVYISAMFVKERYRIGELFPSVSKKYAFFRR